MHMFCISGLFILGVTHCYTSFGEFRRPNFVWHLLYFEWHIDGKGIMTIFPLKNKTEMGCFKNKCSFSIHWTIKGLTILLLMLCSKIQSRTAVSSGQWGPIDFEKQELHRSRTLEGTQQIPPLFLHCNGRSLTTKTKTTEVLPITWMLPILNITPQDLTVHPLCFSPYSHFQSSL